jgi:hypothetical protein
VRTSEKSHSRGVCGRMFRSPWQSRCPGALLTAYVRSTLEILPRQSRPRVGRPGRMKATTVIKLLYNHFPRGWQSDDGCVPEIFGNPRSCGHRATRADTLCLPNCNGLGPGHTRSGKRGGETTSRPIPQSEKPWQDNNRKQNQGTKITPRALHHRWALSAATRRHGETRRQGGREDGWWCALRNLEVATRSGTFQGVRAAAARTDLPYVSLYTKSPGPIPPVTASERGHVKGSLPIRRKHAASASASASASHPPLLGHGPVLNPHSPTARPLCPGQS